MELPVLLALILVITACFYYINHRFVGLPTTVGVMALALLFSILLIVLQYLQIDQHLLPLPLTHYSKSLLKNFDYSKTVVDGLLCFLLFAGSLEIPSTDIQKQKGVISFLATASVFISSLVFGFLLWWVSGLILEAPIPFLYCLLVGAVVSPTDPIAVLAMLKKAKAPRQLQCVVSGESLFNDGVGIVTVLLVLGLIQGGADKGELALVESTVINFIWEVGGAICYGLFLGYIFKHLVKPIDEYRIEIFLSIAVVYGGYILGSHLGMSGPIAIVVMGIYTGNVVRVHAMSKQSKEYLDTFWSLLDDFLNAVIFTLLGLEMLSVSFSPYILPLCLLAIVIGLFSRFLSVALPISVFPGLTEVPRRQMVYTLTWGGLRGALSIALAFSLPDSEYKPTILALSYAIVVFSVLVQALTMERFVLCRLQKRS